MKKKVPLPTTPSTMGTVAKKTVTAVVRAVLERRHMIIGCAAVAVAALLLMLLIPLLPRTTKPRFYKAGELELKSITEVVGYRKLLGMSQSLSGLGRAQAGEYSYKAGKDPKKDIEDYLELLTDEYGAVVGDGAQLGEAVGNLTVTIPGSTEGQQVELFISYDSEKYTVTMGEKQAEVPKPEKIEALITPEEARNLLLTLTKEETGFKSDISVYTSNLEPDTVNVDGWDYYVFTVLADYSATRIEYRGTFYVSCQDGAMMSYDKETKTTSRIKRE